MADLVQQMYDATEGDGQKQIMQKIYDGVNNVLERMDNAMEKYDDGKTGKVSIEVNVIRVCMEEVNTYITGIQQKSVNEMDEATAQSHATYQAVSKVCVGMAAVSINWLNTRTICPISSLPLTFRCAVRSPLPPSISVIIFMRSLVAARIGFTTPIRITRIPAIPTRIDTAAIPTHTLETA